MIAVVMIITERIDIPHAVWAAVDTLHRCGIIDVPDIPCRAFQDNKGLTHMIVAHRIAPPDG